jgi:hypothetical protein
VQEPFIIVDTHALTYITLASGSSSLHYTCLRR